MCQPIKYNNRFWKFDCSVFNIFLSNLYVHLMKFVEIVNASVIYHTNGDI